MGKVSEKEGVQQLAALFYKHGVRKIVFSPGSRNAPLVVSFANDTRFDSIVIPDERSAAFYALGMAEESKAPVAIVCSSGSAPLNYYPAISEAFYRNIPLIVVTADRPSEWTDQGDGQTIRQQDVYKNHICASVSLFEMPSSDVQRWFNRRKINELLITAKSVTGGPVHFNFPFNEPLYNQIEKKGTEEEHKSIIKLELGVQLTGQQKKELSAIWNASPKKLILCGQLPKNNYLNEQLKNLATDKSVAIVVENTSNLQDRNFVHCIDRTITSFIEDEQELYQPDLLITIGGAVVSKKMKKYLRENQPKNHWKIGTHFPFMDTYQSLTTSIPMDPNSFFDLMLEEKLERDLSRYGEQWKQLDYLAKDQHDAFLSTAPYSDLTVFDFILDAVPDQSFLHLSNSSVVRYAQLFDPIKSIHYFCNRGTSGIDGVMSTALGVTLSSGEEKVNTLIVGDMSFFYDSNAFWNHHLPTNFRVFLINNGGGGIFDIIPGPQETPNKDQFFVAKQSFSAQSICEAFDINYFKADSIEEIDKQLDTFYDILPNNRPAVMEINTVSMESSKVLSEYFGSIKVKEIPVLKV